MSSVESNDYDYFIFLADRELLVDLPNVYNYQSFLETERAGYVIRQWLANNLYDRIRCVSSNNHPTTP